MSDTVESADEAPRRRRFRPGLSAKLLLLTIIFVMVAEVLVFVPSVSNFRKQWLMARLDDAQIAALAAEAAPGGQLPKTLRDKLLQIPRPAVRYLQKDGPPRVGHARQCTRDLAIEKAADILRRDGILEPSADDR